MEPEFNSKAQTRQCQAGLSLFPRGKSEAPDRAFDVWGQERRLMSGSHSHGSTKVQACQVLTREDCQEIAQMVRRGQDVPEVHQATFNRAERRAIARMSDNSPEGGGEKGGCRTGGKPWCGLWVQAFYRQGEAAFMRLFCYQAACIICTERLQASLLRVLRDRAPVGCWRQPVPSGKWDTNYKRLQRQKIDYLRVRNSTHAELLTLGNACVPTATWLPPSQYENFLKEIIVPDADHVRWAKRITHSRLFNPRKKEKWSGWERIVIHKSLETVKGELLALGLPVSVCHQANPGEVDRVLAELPGVGERLYDYLHPYGVAL